MAKTYRDVAIDQMIAGANGAAERFVESGLSRHPMNHAHLDRLTLPSNGIVWRPERQPRTEA
jgi:hypothetical protein